MTIRIATLKDIEKIMFLEKQVFDLHSKARPDWIGKNPIKYDYIKSIIEGSNGEIFIAENENEVIGHCIVIIQEIKNHHLFHDMVNVVVEDLCIDEKYRLKGVGKKLFEEIKVFAKEKNAKFIELSVWEFNQNAKQFYEHLGMKTRICKMELRVDN